MSQTGVGDVAAFFDVDGTVTRTTVLHPLIWHQRARLPRLQYWFWFAGLCLQVPGYILLDRRDRAAFTRKFYQRYAGLRAAEVKRFHQETFASLVQPRIYPGAAERLAWHRAQGHRLILVSGGIDLTLRPLAEYLHADELLCVRLEEKDGVLTGALATPPMIDVEKARAVRACAGIDLARSYAYGDSLSDSPMLQAVGNPVAVNADKRLRRFAQEHGWACVPWKT
jgi:HAD superfamily hydrolase (TIGR01490 family)